MRKVLIYLFTLVPLCAAAQSSADVYWRLIGAIANLYLSEEDEVDSNATLAFARMNAGLRADSVAPHFNRVRECMDANDDSTGISFSLAASRAMAMHYAQGLVVTSACPAEVYCCKKKNVYVSALDNGKWTKPQALKTVNTKSTELDAFVSPDGKFLFFASDREGGYGGFDIYFCRRLPNGAWSKAQNAGPNVNTPANERVPFFLSSRSSLLFVRNNNEALLSAFNEEENNFAAAYIPEESDAQSSAHANLVVITGSLSPSTGLPAHQAIPNAKEPTNTAVPFEETQIVVMKEGKYYGTYKPNARTGRFILIFDNGGSYEIIFDNGTISQVVNIEAKNGDRITL